MNKKNLVETRVKEISRLHNEILILFSSGLEKAIKIGALLEEQKKSLSHGKFIPWITKNLPFGERTARNYMATHRNRNLLKRKGISDLSGAYRALTEPKIEKISKEELLKRAQEHGIALIRREQELGAWLIKIDHHHYRSDIEGLITDFNECMTSLQKLPYLNQGHKEETMQLWKQWILSLQKEVLPVAEYLDTREVYHNRWFQNYHKMKELMGKIRLGLIEQIEHMEKNLKILKMCARDWKERKRRNPNITIPQLLLESEKKINDAHASRLQVLSQDK